jgi:hypothetical protein
LWLQERTPDALMGESGQISGRSYNMITFPKSKIRDHAKTFQCCEQGIYEIERTEGP